MGNLCRKCSNCEFGQCLVNDTSIHKISDEQIKQDNYGCFKERFYNINMNSYHPDCEFRVYGDSMDQKQINNIISSLKLAKINNNVSTKKES